LYNNGTDTKRHYTYGNFTKFIRPGYVRVEIGGAVPANVLLSAYKGTDGTVVVVAINKGSAAADVPITISGGTAPASMTPTVTSANDNLKTGTAVTVTGGTFTAALASKTVTTFVGK
jgi:glucuronoarabinoxylan endo-1,4-beta-xylanase